MMQDAEFLCCTSDKENDTQQDSAKPIDTWVGSEVELVHAVASLASCQIEQKR